MQLLTSNAKLDKDHVKFLPLGLQLAPKDEAGQGDVCPHASEGCAKACIFSAGRGAMPNVITARIARTIFFFQERERFFSQLFEEIQAGERKATRKGLKLAVRLNVFSDIAWERVKFKGKNVFDHFPHIQFYDYTKNDKRALAYVASKVNPKSFGGAMAKAAAGGHAWPDNYHLTFSRSESNQDEVAKVLAAGGNVAAVFHKQLPSIYLDKPVIDGDKSDLRFQDPQGCIVGLVDKGKGKRDKTGFVIHE